MWREVLEHLVTDPQGCYLDCTLGGGGHSAAILSRLDPGGPGKVVALDQDPDALAFATRRLADAAAQGRFRALRANFRSVRAVVEAEGCMPQGGFTGACVRACRFVHPSVNSPGIDRATQRGELIHIRLN